MSKPRVVLDTKVVVSAVIKPGLHKPAMKSQESNSFEGKGPRARQSCFAPLELMMRHRFGYALPKKGNSVRRQSDPYRR